METLIVKYKRAGVKDGLLGFARQRRPGAVAQVVFINDKGYFVDRHGGLQPSPDPEWSHRALFHCCGPEYQAFYNSFLDFSPCEGPVSYGKDHKKRRVTLIPYATAVFVNDEQLSEWFK